MVHRQLGQLGWLRRTGLRFLHLHGAVWVGFVAHPFDQGNGHICIHTAARVRIHHLLGNSHKRGPLGDQRMGEPEGGHPLFNTGVVEA